MQKNRRLCSGFYYNLKERDFYLFCTVIVVDAFLTFIRAIGTEINFKQHSFFDLYHWNMGEAVNIVFIHTIAFLILASKVFIYGKDDIFFILHQNSKKNIWMINIFSAFLITLFFTGGNFLAITILSINKNMFQFEETEILIGLLGNSFVYFLCISLVYYILLYLFRKKDFAFIGTLVIIFFEYILHLCKIHSLINFTMLGNILPSDGYGSENIGIHLVYWVIMLGVFCFLSYWITTKSDIIIWKKSYFIFVKNSSFYKAFISTINHLKGKIFGFTILIGVIFFYLGNEHILDSKTDRGTLLSFYYVGSNRIDVKFMLWLFLELVITIFAVNRMYQLLNYNIFSRLLQLKTRKKCANYFLFLISMELAYFFLTITAAVSFCLWMFHGKVIDIIIKDLNLNYLNTFLSMICFCFCVCLIHLYLKNVSQSYLIILAVQQFHMVLYRLFGGFCCFLPLIHGCTELYKNKFSDCAAFTYQTVEIILLSFLFRKRLIKYLSE